MDEDFGFFGDPDLTDNEIVDFEVGLPMEDDLYDFGHFDDDPSPYDGTYSEE